MLEKFGLQHLTLIANGALVTIVLCAVAGVAGILIGLLLGMASTSNSAIARRVSAVYINIIRGLPLLIIIFFIYFGLPLLFPGTDLSKTISAGVALSIYAGAYMGEVVRGGIESTPKGQFEAAEALGLGYFSKFRYVILPQAMKVMIPPGIGFLIALVKDSSLVSVIGFVELTKAGRIVSSLTMDPLTTFLIVAGFYFVICYPLSKLGQRYERGLSKTTGALRPRTLDLNLKIGNI